MKSLLMIDYHPSIFNHDVKPCFFLSFIFAIKSEVCQEYFLLANSQWCIRLAKNSHYWKKNSSGRMVTVFVDAQREFWIKILWLMGKCTLNFHLIWILLKKWIHCPAKTWIYLTPYVCTERIFDGRPFMYN